MRTLSRLIRGYLLLTGLAVNLALAGLLLFRPDLGQKAYYKAIDWLEQKAPATMALVKGPPEIYRLDEEILANFGNWEPLGERVSRTLPPGPSIDGKSYPSLTEAAANLEDGDTLYITEGIYRQPMVIHANHVTVKGIGHVVLAEAAAEGKGAIVAKGDGLRIENIECHGITVRDHNGACVRLEGQGLHLNHVYFHDSQSGLLTGNRPGRMVIENSRFERLGNRGSAHGIYTNGGELILRNSLFIAARDEGHEIKSRSRLTLIDRCIIASLSSRDSRLVDVPDGGILKITRSILEQGPLSSNQDMIGYGMEHLRHAENRVELRKNIFILERKRGNVLFHKRPELPEPVANDNLVISREPLDLPGLNLHFPSREEAGLQPYPILPALPSAG